MAGTLPPILKGVYVCDDVISNPTGGKPMTEDLPLAATTSKGRTRAAMTAELPLADAFPGSDAGSSCPSAVELTARSATVKKFFAFMVWWASLRRPVQFPGDRGWESAGGRSRFAEGRQRQQTDRHSRGRDIARWPCVQI